MKINVSRTMSTQHPDNVRPPFFSSNSILGGEEEIKEAFYIFSHLGSREQLWDCEGKEVDNSVVKKLLTRYEPYFMKNKLGKDVFLTIRVPNPEVEKAEAKILLESLESIPRSCDAASLFYGEDIAPIFEVAVPMVKSHKVLLRIYEYYKQLVVGKKNTKLIKDDITIANWIGKFEPDEIRVFPLVEEKDALLNADKIAETFIKEAKVKDYQRVWLARSDPALNYSSLANALLCKITLQRLYKLQERSSIDILPVMGCGAVPFRGNFKPTNVKSNLRGYPSIQTFTTQSAFKYDYPRETVVEAIKTLNETKRKKPIVVDEKKCLEIIDRLSDEYQKQIKLLAPYINDFATYIPKRRLRKLHIGLFGYARATAGVKLPRAIKFCASLYSLGLPPELLGINVLKEKDVDYIKDIYPTFQGDLDDAAQYFNKDNLSYFPAPIKKAVTDSMKFTDIVSEKHHQKITSIILENYKDKRFDVMSENILRAGWIRGFLG